MLPEKLTAMLKEIEEVEELPDKYQTLIDMGKDLPDIPAQMKNEKNLVRGCQSQVWVYAELKQGNIYFYGQADSMIVNGMLALLVNGLSDISPRGFLEISPEFIKGTGVVATLTPSRVNGFYNIHEKMRAEAWRLML